MCSIAEIVLQPLFVVQTRLINQSQNFKIFKNSLEIVKKCGIRSMWAGWGSVVPRQFVFSLWAGCTPEIEKFLRKVLGTSSGIEGMLREVLAGIGGYLLVYPLVTATRRVAAFGEIIGMSTLRYSGVFNAFFKICKDEGAKALFRGFGCYAIAVLFN